MMRNRFWLAVLMRSMVVWLALAGASAALAQSLEIIELRNRPAEQVIPIVQPMLEKGGALSGTGFQLFVRTSPANLAQIRQMVASLDRAARQLIIQVRQDADSRDSRFDARAGVVLEPGNSRAGGSITDSASQDRNNIAQQVRTQEGSPAFIQAGTSQLVPSRTVTRTVNGRLGQWIEVGGTSQSRLSEGSGILARSSEAGVLEQRIYLRVEEVK